MRPQAHVAVSAGLGAVFWARSRDWRTMALSLGFGVLVDLDHLVDYWYSERRLTWDTKTFMRTRYWRRSGRIFLLFHAFEYLPLVYFAWHAWKGRRWAMAATSAMSSHVLADHLVNELRPLGYFILWRASKRFRAAEIMDWHKVQLADEAWLRRTRGEAPPFRWYERLMAWFA